MRYTITNKGVAIIAEYLRGVANVKIIFSHETKILPILS